MSQEDMGGRDSWNAGIASMIVKLRKQGYAELPLTELP